MAEKKEAEELEKLWHTTAHVFADALTELYPKAKIAIGPPIEWGFHYDFELDKNIDGKDLEKIENRMREILSRKEKLTRKEISTKEALQFFNDNPYKVEMIKDLAAKGEKTVLIYYTGKFVDLCKGPHLESTEPIKAVKLLKISSAYWKGDEKNKVLQRVYGIGFKTQKELDNWLEMRKKAEKNSNVKLGKELDLYMISEEVGKGLPIWTPKGTLLRMQLQEFLTKEQIKRGYSFLITPHIAKLDLFKKSGHYDNYREMMYAPIKIDDEEYLLKPMNCPFHIQYYMRKPKSYRDLPLRLSEMGTVYRYEKSGELSGLLRVRGFTQDDAHIFCTPEQVKEEFKAVFDMVMRVMKVLGLENFRVRIGTRDEKSTKYIGDIKNWERATKEIIEVLEECKIKFEINEGDAAFYGPKADILIKDSLEREWQTGTIQLDYNLPERFELEYIAADGKKHSPVMIHRAPFGSFERFVGIIIEHFGGAFPLWLAPEQVRIIPVSEKFAKYGKKVRDELAEKEIRCVLDDSNETLGYRIREGQKEKIPYILVVGAKEEEDSSVAIRDRQGKQEVMKMEKFIQNALKEIAEKSP
ncbi:MAG: threonine--tRNA ligase [Candidatus Diapherotrites archaeon]|nr:threonine--tRNA ligase [Candidatus Diapherotrites archaeon]